MNQTSTTRFTPPVDATAQDYDALRLTTDELRKIAETGHLVATSLPPNVVRK
ncbi:hypothetical protein NFI99_12695 (plasmid) [Burkholderia glumae]|uniref:Uncharacterized protein n=1 Tax=Burkholderia glumae TaxID=337 RepID=A0ABY5BDK8_BURGL|nr:hypothetical protein [Burkholderia glumae]USS44144.1 hypothetical protein NFI99_12695 [Burkholderia glumae]